MIKEGMIKKGGRNEKPSSPRPKNPPKGQGLRRSKTIRTFEKIDEILQFKIKGIINLPIGGIIIEKEMNFDKNETKFKIRLKTEISKKVKKDITNNLEEKLDTFWRALKYNYAIGKEDEEAYLQIKRLIQQKSRSDAQGKENNA